MKSDTEFVQSLIFSKKSVEAAAAWLESRGYEVIVNPTRIRPTREQIDEFKDGGDTKVKIDGEWQIIEVKEIKFKPLSELAGTPHRLIVLDNAASFDRTHPFGYVLVEKPRRLFGVVKVADSVHRMRREWRWIWSDREWKLVIRIPMSEIKLFKVEVDDDE